MNWYRRVTPQHYLGMLPGISERGKKESEEERESGTSRGIGKVWDSVLEGKMEEKSWSVRKNRECAENSRK